MGGSCMRTRCIRLTRGMDIYESLKRLANEEDISAACVLSMVGCVSRARLRCAGGDRFYELSGPLEIVSCTGTVSRERVHVHVAFSDRALRTMGGHLKEGCIVDTTAEIVLLLMEDTRFLSVFDPETGYNELKIETVEEE